MAPTTDEEMCAAVRESLAPPPMHYSLVISVKAELRPRWRLLVSVVVRPCASAAQRTQRPTAYRSSAQLMSLRFYEARRTNKEHSVHKHHDEDEELEDEVCRTGGATVGEQFGEPVQTASCTRTEGARGRGPPHTRRRIRERLDGWPLPAALLCAGAQQPHARIPPPRHRSSPAAAISCSTVPPNHLDSSPPPTSSPKKEGDMGRSTISIGADG
jgi:hypothetical protein